MKRLAAVFIFIPVVAWAALPLLNISISSKSPSLKCILETTNQAMPPGWKSVAFVVATIETQDRSLASITILARNPPSGSGATYDLLVTSTDSNGWNYFQAGGDLGIATYSMKQTAQLIQRRTATRLGVVDLSSCQ